MRCERTLRLSVVLGASVPSHQASWASWASSSRNSALLKTIQRQIRIPYTVVVFLLIVTTSSGYDLLTSREQADYALKAVGAQAITAFVPAFVVHTTQGINNYIFRRCRIEIMVFSVGTFSELGTLPR